LLPSNEFLPKLQDEFGKDLYSLAVIPSGTYRGIDKDLGTIGVKNLLVASSQLSDDLVAQILKVIFDNKDALVAAHPEARHLELPSSFDDTIAPYHSGALRFYKERKRN
jgi:TRAP transporter TAXI family solute receptor